MMHLVLSKLGLVLQLDPQELVGQLQIHELLVVTLALLQLVRLVQLVLAQLQLVLVLLQLVLAQVQRVRLLLVQQVLRLVQVLVVVPLELVEHPYLPKKFEVPKNVKRQENLAYLF
jgi:hypothetical protein